MDTLSEKAYVRLHLVLSFLYLATAAVFWLFPNEVLAWINSASTLLRVVEPLPPSTERFWNVLAAALFLTLGLLSIAAARNPEIKGYGWVHLGSKSASAAAFATLFFREKHYLAYILAAVIDTFIALLILWRLILLHLSPKPVVEQPPPEKIE